MKPHVIVAPDRRKAPGAHWPVDCRAEGFVYGSVRLVDSETGEDFTSSESVIAANEAEGLYLRHAAGDDGGFVLDGVEIATEIVRRDFRIERKQPGLFDLTTRFNEV